MKSQAGSAPVGSAGILPAVIKSIRAPARSLPLPPSPFPHPLPCFSPHSPAYSPHHKSVRKPSLNPDLTQTRSLPQFFQLFGSEPSQNRQRAVFPDQTVSQKYLSDCRIKSISNWVPVKIDYNYPFASDPVHLTEYLYYFLLAKVMRKQRAHRIIKTFIRKWQFQCISSHRTNTRKLSRLLDDCPD